MLYDRDYVRSGEKSSSLVDSNTRAAIEVYKYVGLSILAAGVGSWVGMDMVATVSKNYIWFVLLEFALIFGLIGFRNKPGVNILLLFAFTFMTGFTLSPMLAVAINLHPGVLTTAFLSTGVAVGGASLYGITTKKDLRGWSKYLFPILIVVVVAGLINLFLKSSVLNLVISLVSAVLFTFYLIFDTQRVINRDYDSPIAMAVSVYLDILNIFISILNILMSSRD